MKESKGDLAKTSFPKLLHSIYLRRDRAGVLDIIKEPVKKRFFFRDGMPVSSTSNVLGEVLGRLLLEEGIITQADYEKSLEVVIREKKKHGEVLISMGLLKPQELEAFLTLQLKRRLLNIFGWEEGAFRYVKTDAVPGGLTIMPVHPAAIILDGISLGFYPSSRLRTDLEGYLSKKLTLNLAAFERYRPDDFHLNLQEKRFLENFNGERTLAEVLGTSDLLRHRALSLALSFVITGLVKGVGEPEAAAEEMEELKEEPAAEGVPVSTRLNAELSFMRAKSALINGEYSTARELLGQITELNPVEGEYWAYLGWAVFKENPTRAAEAINIIKDAIDLNNDLASAWYFLGAIALARGDEALSIRALRKAVEKNPWMLKALAELKRLEIRRFIGTRVFAEERKAYLDAYGFEEDPFTPLPLPGVTSFVGSQERALDFLVKNVKKRSGPILIEGASGLGKTTIAIEALERLSNEKVLCLLLLKPPEKELDLIRAINAEAGAPAEAKTVKEQLLALGMRLSQNKIQGGHSVLIIDSAHTLTSGGLKLIQYLSRLKTLQIVLLAEPMLQERLKDQEFVELCQKLQGRFTLTPLGPGETKEYIYKRLTGARRKPGIRLMPDIDMLAKGAFEESGGVPALINESAARILAAEVSRAKKALLEEDKGASVRPSVKSALETPAVLKAPEKEETFAFIEEEKAEEVFTFLEEAPPVEKKSKPPAPVATPPAEKEPPKAEKPVQRPVEKPRPGIEKKAKVEEARKPVKRGFLRLILLVVLMLVAGLAIGSAIGTFWIWPSGKTVTRETPAVKPPESLPRGVDAPSMQPTTEAPSAGSVPSGGQAPEAGAGPQGAGAPEGNGAAPGAGATEGEGEAATAN